MVSGLLFALALTAQDATPETPAYREEAARIVTRWRAEEDCRTQPRPQGESVEACADRRQAAVAATPGYEYFAVGPVWAGQARTRCEAGEQRAEEAPGACIHRIMIVIQSEDDLFGPPPGPIDVDSLFEPPQD